MAKIAPQLKAMIEDFVDSLAADVVLERVFLWGGHVSGKPSEHSDIRLVVISPSFEGKDRNERLAVLAKHTLEVNPLLQAWGYTPQELLEAQSRQGGDPLLGMMLNKSREVFVRTPANPRMSR